MKKSLCSVLFFVSVCLSPFCIYYFLVNKSFEKEEHGKKTSFRNFLLEEIPSPRIIIDSGSNSFHGIYAPSIEKEFQIPCINVADDGAIPFFMRVARLREQTGKGDIIVLPLEYVHYTRSEIPNQVYIRMHRDLHYFHDNLSLSEKIKFVSSIPAATLIDNFLSSNDSPNLNHLRKSTWLHQFLGSSGDFESYGSPSQWQYPTGMNFTTWNYGDNAFDEVCDEFLFGISKLSELRESGRTILFTWPVICGSKEELRIARSYSSFYQKIRQNVEDAGFVFLGEPEETMFDADKFMYDTPAHLNEKGRQIRTELLIEHLKPHLDSLNLKKDLNHTTIHHLQQKHRAYLKEELSEFAKIQPKSFNLQRRAPRKAKELCFLGQGWGSWEQNEVWSVGEKSIIYLKTPIKKRWDIAELKICGFYHNKLKSSKLSVAGRSLGDFDLRLDNTIKLIPSMVGRNGMLELSIKHISPQSPSEISESTDRRKLAFRWENISLSFIENAHFADCYEEVKTWYGKYLNRVPDHKGHLFWTNALVAIKTEDDRKKLEASFGREAMTEVSE